MADKFRKKNVFLLLFKLYELRVTRQRFIAANQPNGFE